MFTVLIAAKEHIDAIQQNNKLFFEPFLGNKELAFCEWNPAGQNLQDSVPGLMGIVGRRKEWRAVIVQDGVGDLLKKQNPFDVVGYESLASLSQPNRQPDENEPREAWGKAWTAYFAALMREQEILYKTALEHPLQKLSTWLCFRPEDYILNDVKEKQDVQDWAMEQLGRDETKASARLEFLERKHSKDLLRLKECLRREFAESKHLNIAYPVEICCISTRTADNGFFDPDDYWNTRQESEYSDFADRNMYFDKQRFLVFDLLPKTHRNYRNDYIRFLASILLLASNPIPGSALQTRRLYRLETETDDTPLCTLATSYDKKLSDTWDIITGEMEKIRAEIPEELSDKTADALFCHSTSVSVVLDDSCEPEKVCADNSYGLFSDAPENEQHKWNRDYRASGDALSYIVKQQGRAVAKSVNQMHAASEISGVNVNRLTPFQMNDVRDYTDGEEDKMIQSIPGDFTDVSKYKAQLQREGEEVKKAIRRRMTMKTTLILGAVCLGLYLACLLPFLLSNHGTTRTISTAIVLCCAMLGAVAVALFIALLSMREKLKSAVKGYNEVARRIIHDIQGAMNHISEYLTASCNVRRGHAVQNYAENNLDEYTKSLRIRKKHQEDIRKRRAELAELYADFLEDKSFCDETMSRPYDYDFDQRVEYPYPAPFLAGDCRQIEFISKGHMVTVPSSYVTRMLVRMEGIYDK